MNNIRKFLARSTSEKILFLQVIFLLPFFQCAIKLIPFRYLKTLLKLKQNDTTMSTESAFKQSDIEQIRWAIKTAKHYFPYLPGRCLAQALTARQLLRQRKIPCRIYLGARHEQDHTMTAHAWLCCGKIILTGGKTMKQYKKIASFT